MTQADSVHSTPPTNTSPTRRNILGTIAAAGAMALTLTPARAAAAAPGAELFSDASVAIDGSKFKAVNAGPELHPSQDAAAAGAD